MNRIDIASNHPQSRDTPGRAEAPRGRTGTLNGEQVAVKDTQSMLADAAEEISLHHSEKLEQKRFSERQFAPARVADILKASEIAAYLDAAGHGDDPARLEDVVRSMLASRADPREVARQQSRDPAHQFVLLQHALAQARESGEPRETVERLKDALADLEMESGPGIRAGLNTMATVAGLAATPQARERFQDTYRDVVLGRGTLSQTLLVVLERLGGAQGEDFRKGLLGLIKALGADLSAERPSTASSRLQALVEDLYQLEVAVTVLEDCASLSRDLVQRYGTAPLGVVQLIRELITITGENWVSPGRFSALSESFRLQLLGERLVFHSTVRDLMRRMPVKVFNDLDSRRAVIDSAQNAYDRVAEEESEQQEKEEDT